MEGEERKKALKLAKKLKALEDRGATESERAKAGALLKNLLEKHGISEDEVKSSVKLYSYFKYEKGQQPLLEMIMCHVVCNALILTDAKKRNTLFIECKKEEADKIRKMFHFYLECYKHEEEYFLHAFIHKNNLVPNIKTQEADIQAGEQNFVRDLKDTPPPPREKPKEKNESSQTFNVKNEPAPAQERAYSRREQDKIRGLMSWMPKYTMTEDVLAESKERL